MRRREHPGQRRRPDRLLRLVVFLVASGMLSVACASRGPVGEDPAAIDEWINAEVRRVLEEEPEVVVEDLRIETRDGILVLSGVQHSLEAVSKALDRASRVRGVVQVVNHIRVVEGVDQPWAESP